MLCMKTAESDITDVCYGRNCFAKMFDRRDELTVDEHGDDRKVITVLHYFKAYDGMFVVNHLYKTHHEVSNQITQGTKILSLTSGDLKSTFSQPATFGVNELCEGFFPHKFNTLENQKYVGAMLPANMSTLKEWVKRKRRLDFEESNTCCNTIITRSSFVTCRRIVRFLCHLCERQPAEWSRPN